MMHVLHAIYDWMDWPSKILIWILLGLLGLTAILIALMILLGVVGSIVSFISWLRTRQHRLWLSTLPSYEAEADDLVLAYRYAYMVYTEDALDFRSLAYGVRFGTTAKAECAKDKKDKSPEHIGHEAPDEDCSCGFYGLKSALPLVSRTNHILTRKYACLLQVRFSGKFVPATDGYRAYRQDVLKVWVQSRCHHTFCRRPAIALAVEHSQLEDQGRGRYLGSICERHAAEHEIIYTLAELRDHFRTEFEWMG